MKKFFIANLLLFFYIVLNNSFAAGTSFKFQYKALKEGETEIVFSNRGRRIRLTALNHSSIDYQYENRFAYFEKVKELQGDEKTIEGFILRDQGYKGATNFSLKKQASSGEGLQFTASIKNKKLVNVKKLEGELTSEQNEFLKNFFGRPGLTERIGKFLNNKKFTKGQSIKLPSSVIEGVTISFLGLEKRWERMIAIFDLNFKTPEFCSGKTTQCSAIGTGQIYIDKDTGRLLEFNVLGRVIGESLYKGTTYNVLGTFSILNSRSFSDIKLFGLDVELSPPTQPTGNISEVILTHDDKKLLIRADNKLENSGQFPFWDTTTQKLVNVISGLDHIATATHSRFLTSWGETGLIQGYLFAGMDAKPFGLVDRIWDDKATSHVSLGVYSILGFADGDAALINTGYNDIFNVIKISKKPIVSLAISVSAKRLASLDEEGMFTLHALEFDTNWCDGRFLTSFCEKAPARILPDLLNTRLLTITGRNALYMNETADWIAYPNAIGTIKVEPINNSENKGFTIDGTVASFSMGLRVIVSNRGVWDISSGKQLKQFNLNLNDANNLALTSDTKIAYISVGDELFMVDVQTGLQIAKIGKQSFPAYEAFWDDQGIIVFGKDKMGRLDLLKRKVEFSKFPNPTSKHHFISRENDFVTASLLLNGRSHITTGSLGNRSLVLREQDLPAERATTIKISHDGQRVALGYLDGRVQVNAIETGKIIYELHTNGSQAISDITFDPVNTNIIYAVDFSGLLTRIDTVRHESLFKDIPKVSGKPLIALSGDGKLLAVSSTHNSYNWNQNISVIQIRDSHTLNYRSDLHPRWGEVTAMTLNRDGSTVIAGDANGFVRIWDSKSGRMLSEFVAHSGAINGVQWNPDEKLYITASQDGTVKIWDSNVNPPKFHTWDLSSYEISQSLNIGNRQPHLIATMALIGNTDFIIATPDGYYTATKGALSQIAFRQGKRMFDFEQYDLLLNRPDIVLSRLGLLNTHRKSLLQNAFRKRLFRAENGGQSIDLWNAKLPVIEITDTPNLVVKDPEITIAYKAKDEQGLAKIKVSVNSVPMVEKVINSSLDSQGELNIPLTYGANRIEINAINVNGNHSKKSYLMANRIGIENSELWVLAIGVSEYKDSLLQLQNAAKDADDLSEFFLNTKSQHFSKPHILTITNNEVTKKHQLLERGRKFLAQAKPGDQIVIFFSGHGFLDNTKDYYFGTYDVDPLKPRQSGLSFPEISSLFDGVTAQRRLLLIDSCHSGELDPNTENVLIKLENGINITGKKGVTVVKSTTKFPGLSFEAMREYFSDLTNETGAHIISAASGLDYAIDSKKLRNGVFTYAIIEGLRELKADRDGNGIVMVSELRTYVNQRVMELTHGDQRPTVRAENIFLDFPVL